MVCQLQVNCTYAAFCFVHLTKVCEFAWYVPNLVANDSIQTLSKSDCRYDQDFESNKLLLLSDTETINMSVLTGGVFRPRGALARTLYDKQINDGKLRQLNKSDWYKVDKSRLSPSTSSKFCQLYIDSVTREFITNAIEKSSWIWTQIWHVLAKAMLGFFWTRTDINGWLGRGSMFILSLNQLRMLLNIEENVDKFGGAMIDIGAGDGEVTKHWLPMFDSIYATEISSSMRNSLSEKGYSVLDTDTWWQGRKFKTICLLNLLDRCSQPLTILNNAKQALDDDGIIIVALVLPFKPYVEYVNDHKQEELLPISGSTFEDQVESFIEFADKELNLEVGRWTRVPYLCEGDVNQSYYWLDDIIVTLKIKT